MPLVHAEICMHVGGARGFPSVWSEVLYSQRDARKTSVYAHLCLKKMFKNRGHDQCWQVM